MILPVKPCFNCLYFFNCFIFFSFEQLSIWGDSSLLYGAAATPRPTARRPLPLPAHRRTMAAGAITGRRSRPLPPPALAA